MTCQQLTEFLGDYVAGVLDAGERAAFEHHLADCPHCIAYVRGYHATIRLAKDSAATDADAAMPPEVVDAILAATRTRRPC